MGLGTTPDCGRFSYSGFHHFRVALAKEAGIDLEKMVGFGEWRAGGPSGAIEWETLPPDAIHVLLNHSDCSGSIKNADCLPLAQRLNELAETMPDRDHAIEALRFALGLRIAHLEGVDVEFH